VRIAAAPVLRTGALLATIGAMTGVVTFSAQALQGAPDSTAPASARAVLTDGGVVPTGAPATALAAVRVPALRSAPRPPRHHAPPAPPAPTATLVTAPVPTPEPVESAPATPPPAPAPVVRAPAAPPAPAPAPSRGPSFDSSG
jgi:hypothetical protein